MQTPIKPYDLHEAVKEGSLVSDLSEKRKNISGVITCINGYAVSFAPRDNDGTLLKAGLRIPWEGARGELIKRDLKVQCVPENKDIYLQKSDNFDSGWDVLIGQTYQHANLSPEAAAQTKDLPTYEEVLEVEDGRLLFDKEQMKTTVHAAPKGEDEIDKRPKEERMVFEAAQKQLSMYPPRENYTLQGMLGSIIILSEQDEQQSLQGEDAKKAFEALPNNRGKNFLEKYARDAHLRSTLKDLVTPGPKNHVTSEQSRVGNAYIANVPVKKSDRHESIKEASFVSDLCVKRKGKAVIAALNVYSSGFAPKDNYGNFLKADVRVPWESAGGELIKRELKAQSVPENKDIYLQKSDNSDSGWNVLIGPTYQSANFSPEAAKQADSLPPYGEVIGVEDGRPLFDKDQMDTTVHAALADKADKRPEVERIVFQAAQKQLSMYPPQASYKLQRTSGSIIIFPEQGEQVSLQGEDAMKAFEALPNDRGRAYIEKCAGNPDERMTMKDLVTQDPKNPITPEQSKAGIAIFENAPINKSPLIKEGSFVSDLCGKRKDRAAIACVKAYADGFALKDSTGNLLEADTGEAGAEAGGLPLSGEVAGVEDGRPLFDKALSDTTVHAAPADKEDNRPEEERMVFEAAQKHLSMYPSQESYTLQGQSGFILSEHGEGQSLLAPDALAAYEALPNDRGKAFLEEQARGHYLRNTLKDLVTGGPKNPVTPEQSRVGIAIIDNASINKGKARSSKRKRQQSAAGEPSMESSMTQATEGRDQNDTPQSRTRTQPPHRENAPHRVLESALAPGTSYARAKSPDNAQSRH